MVHAGYAVYLLHVRIATSAASRKHNDAQVCTRCEGRQSTTAAALHLLTRPKANKPARVASQPTKNSNNSVTSMRFPVFLQADSYVVDTREQTLAHEHLLLMNALESSFLDEDIATETVRLIILRSHSAQMSADECPLLFA
eukprot:TRINITY_DN11628_c0_g1_i21.p3 TRINITY_DN11628_c0_g1~~TRINITY_DN11628_c0_g1_i21.p3  ORF type:complete len:141 (+),score=22.57 TRINITY_DN11628_c0_g1_i21:804-1226(+)